MRIERHVLDAIVGHARGSRPNECCGILLASPQDPATVIDALPADNIEPDRPTDAYVLDYRTQLRALDMEVDGRMHVAGYYHSHPRGSARPSRRDVERAVPDTTYLIVGMAEDPVECRAWFCAGQVLVPAPLETVDG